MEKLELKHLAPYLPHKLRAINLHGKEVEVIGLSNGNDSVSNHLWLFRENDQTGKHYQGYLYECKPLLHPLERLTDKMLHDLAYTDKDRFILEVKNRVVSVVAWDDMIANHYDVFGLIEKGLSEPIKLEK